MPQNFSLAIKWHYCFREAKVDGIPNRNREIFSQKGRILLVWEAHHDQQY